jgi:hypothetical protein
MHGPTIVPWRSIRSLPVGPLGPPPPFPGGPAPLHSRRADGSACVGEDQPVGITQRELLMELRDDVRRIEAAVTALTAEHARLADNIAKEQELGAERRAGMRRQADEMRSRIDDHDRQLDELRRWRDRADGAMILARWALGASLVSLAAVVLQVIAALGDAAIRFGP